MSQCDSCLLLAGLLYISTIICGVEGDTNKPIAHKYVNAYSLIWNDRGSGADRDVSIWRPVDYQSGFYPLGDIAVATHNQPTAVSLTVKALMPDALATPVGYTEIWRDSGSGANSDVKILKMNPSPGYTCLGYVAVDNYGGRPDINKYRCVKSSLVTKGMYQPIWNDKGSGANKDVGLFSNTETGNYKAIFANTFTAVASHSAPGGSPYMLNGDHSILNSLIQAEKSNNVAIKVYQGSDSDLIWKDNGSGARYDISIYRPKGSSGYYPVGDIAVRGLSKPRTAMIVKPMVGKENALANPVSFRRRWTDSGSGASWDVSFWEPVCPYGYVALGHAAVRSHESSPHTNEMACVKHDYATLGEWQWIWDDRGSGASVDVSVYQAVAKDSNGQGMQAMGTVPSHGSMDRTAYVLNSSIVQYIVGKPAKKYILQNVQYLFDDRKVVSNTPEQLARTIVENRGSTEQKATRTIEYTYEQTSDWSVSAGIEIGVSASVTAGIPDVASATTSVSATVSTSGTTGKSVTKSKSDSFAVEMTVQPHSQKTATLVANRYVADIPYEAKLITIYADGTRGVRNQYKGVYRGASIAEVRAVIGEDVPIRTN